MQAAVWALALIGVPAFLVFATLFFRSRERIRLIETVKSAAQSGHPIPADAIYAMRGGSNPLTTHRRDLRRAVVLLSISLGFLLVGFAAYAMIANTDWGGAEPVGIAIAAMGAVPGCIGLAFLVLGLIDRPSGRGG